LTSLSEYYEKNLYPLQDGVLNIISQSGTDFFLTGGTALSRGYYHHRYSDDLDFFINSSKEYDKQLDVILDKLAESGFSWDTAPDFLRNDGFATLAVHWEKNDAALKLDFVNDTVPHFGPIVETGLFYRTDSIRNILSNKLSALFRFAAKDVADIREIFLHEKINWPEIIYEAGQKDAGIDLVMIADVLKSIPESAFGELKWVNSPGWKVFRRDIDLIAEDMMRAE
jgi:predicted nucleotidyltransferase component of viral defense system